MCVLLGEDSGDALRVAVDCVEEPGEGEAEDGSQEKHPDHHLLLDRSHERHVGPEHVHQTQTEEKQAACRESEWQSENEILIRNTYINSCSITLDWLMHILNAMYLVFRLFASYISASIKSKRHLGAVSLFNHSVGAETHTVKTLHWLFKQLQKKKKKMCRKCRNNKQL